MCPPTSCVYLKGGGEMLLIEGTGKSLVRAKEKERETERERERFVGRLGKRDLVISLLFNRALLQKRPMI